MIKEETYGIIWGTALLVIGLVILLFVFSNALDIANDPSGKLEDWVPDEVKGPTAFFVWWSDDKTVDFSDSTAVGDVDISSWYWDFGDGSTSSQQNPSHTYSSIDSFTVTLEVEDGNGNSDSIKARVDLVEGEPAQGQTQAAMSLDLGLETTLKRMAIAVVFFCAFTILVMIGGRILIAGVRLIRPNVKFYKMRMTPKEVEPRTSEQQRTFVKKDKSGEK